MVILYFNSIFTRAMLC